MEKTIRGNDMKESNNTTLCENCGDEAQTVSDIGILLCADCYMAIEERSRDDADSDVNQKEGVI